MSLSRADKIELAARRVCELVEPNGVMRPLAIVAINKLRESLDEGDECDTAEETPDDQ